MSISIADDRILTDISDLLTRILGRGDLGWLDRRTRFFADLGLASIDAVVLGEALEEHYGRPLPFADLMAELGTKTDRDLPMGELVDFLRRNLRD